MHKLASVPGLVTLPLDHPLASHKQISISQLKKESFVGARDSILPGYNQKIVQLCRQFGKFRPRFVAIGQPSDLADALATAANVWRSQTSSWFRLLRRKQLWIYSSFGNVVRPLGPCAPCWTTFSPSPRLRVGLKHPKLSRELAAKRGKRTEISSNLSRTRPPRSCSSSPVDTMVAGGGAKTAHTGGRAPPRGTLGAGGGG
jgi:hypothetical protein